MLFRLVSDDFMTCKITYVVKENTVIYNQTIELNFLILTLAQQKEVNKQIKTIERNYKEIVVLKKNKKE